MKIHRLIVIALSLNFATVSFAQNQDEDIELEKIVVTPYRYDETLAKAAGSITVISQKEIENSNAQNLVDVLRPVEGVVVRDWYSNGTKASVDMAGFGEQAALNVLVLVDGRRVNDVDLSGVDWSQIPLDQVERIEIMRGGSGAVLYGDNASSGVINIITKKGVGKPKINLNLQYGSYDMNRQKVSLAGEIDKKFSYWIDSEHDFTHGYRKNTYEKAKDFASKFGYSFNDFFSLHFNSGFRASAYGLPSGLFQHHLDEQGRRWARYGEDHVDNTDYYFLLGSKNELGGIGNLEIDFSYRRKDTQSYFLTSHNDTLKNKIETFAVTPKYILNNNLFDRDNKLIAGLDYYRSLYRSNNYSYSNSSDWKNYTHINKNSIGLYLQDELSIFKSLALVAGYRYEAARYAFGYHDFTGTNSDRDSALKPKIEAFNSGVVYNYAEDSSVFFNAAKSFRFPEVDEFTGQYDINFHQFLNTDLKPQSQMNYQVGVRHKFTDKVKGDLSVYRMKVKDYIYYNPTGGIYGWGENENYEKSVHQGLESSLEAKINSQIKLSGNYTFTKAYFYGGQYDKDEIPMVPRHKASLGLRVLLPKNFTFNLNGNYVGKRYFINDENNALSRLNGYMVADTNLSWSCKELTVTFIVNNLFNKEYSEYGVYGTDSSNNFVYDKCYFPSPQRNFSLKLDYTF